MQLVTAEFEVLYTCRAIVIGGDVRMVRISVSWSGGL